jgi:serine/threonine-protein kinase
VPNLNGQDYAAAANTLTGLGLVPQRVNESSSTVPAGKVIRTDPNGGFALTGNTVTVVVSSGPPASPSPSPSPTPKKS